MHHEFAQHVQQRFTDNTHAIGDAFRAAFDRDYRVHCRELDSHDIELPGTALAIAFQLEGQGAILVIPAEGDGCRFAGKLDLAAATRIHELADTLAEIVFLPASVAWTRIGIAENADVRVRSMLREASVDCISLSLRLGTELTNVIMLLPVDDPLCLFRTTDAKEPAAIWNNEPMIAMSPGDINSSEIVVAKGASELGVAEVRTTLCDDCPREGSYPAIRLQATVCLSSQKADVDSILQLKPGSIIHIDNTETSPRIVVHGRTIARGDVVVSGDQIALRVA